MKYWLGRNMFDYDVTNVELRQYRLVSYEDGVQLVIREKTTGIFDLAVAPYARQSLAVGHSWDDVAAKYNQEVRSA